VTRRLKC